VLVFPKARRKTVNSFRLHNLSMVVVMEKDGENQSPKEIEGMNPTATNFLEELQSMDQTVNQAMVKYGRIMKYASRDKENGGPYSDYGKALRALEMLEGFRFRLRNFVDGASLVGEKEFLIVRNDELESLKRDMVGLIEATDCFDFLTSEGYDTFHCLDDLQKSLEEARVKLRDLIDGAYLKSLGPKIV
jgi:hypothetical protein